MVEEFKFKCSMSLGSGTAENDGEFLEKCFVETPEFESLLDYSDRKLNINGFVCLKFSLVWGFLSILYYFFIFPWINDYALMFLNNSFCLFSLGMLAVTFSIDLLFVAKERKV